MAEQKSYLTESETYPFRLYETQEMARLLRVTKHYIYRLVTKKVISPIKSRCAKNKNPKYCRSYFLDSELIKGINYRFPMLLPQEKKEIVRRLQKSSRLKRC